MTPKERHKGRERDVMGSRHQRYQLAVESRIRRQLTLTTGMNLCLRNNLLPMCPERTDHIWLISFMHYDLGFFDDETSRVECAPNPFSAKVLPMSPV